MNAHCIVIMITLEMVPTRFDITLLKSKKEKLKKIKTNHIFIQINNGMNVTNKNLRKIIG